MAALAFLRVGDAANATECTCTMPGHGRAVFTTPGNCTAKDSKYASLCAKDLDEDDCDAQTLVGCFWKGHACATDADCTRWCPAPAIKADCLHLAHGVTAE